MSREDYGAAQGIAQEVTNERHWGYAAAAAAPKCCLIRSPLSVNTFDERKFRGEKMSKSNPYKKVKLRHHHNAYSVSSLRRSTGTKDWVLEFFFVFFPRLDAT